MKKLLNYVLPVLAFVALLGSCKKKEYEPIESVDAKKISDFFGQNNLKMSKSDSGYYYQITKVGTGNTLKYSDTLVYQMAVKSLSGKTFFETNKYKPTEMLLGYFPYFLPVQQTFNGIPNGSSIRLVIPSFLAFGVGGNLTLGVGANENLDVNVTSQIIKDRSQYEDSLINLFIKDKGLTGFVKSEEGIYVSILTQGGEGGKITTDSTISANYTLRVLGFDVPVESSKITTNLNSLIKAWGIVLTGQSVGVKLRCLIPSRYAYGDGKSVKTGTVSSNLAHAILDYDIEVTDIQ